MAGLSHFCPNQSHSKSVRKAVIFIAVLVILILVGWLISYQRRTVPQPITPSPAAVQTTNSRTLTQTNATLPPTVGTNTFLRPNSIDENTWNKWMSYRQLILAENQPVEFYVRVVDQAEQPVEGAKLTISLERLDETMFAPTNYLHWDPAAAFQKKFFDLHSDSKGWISITNMTARDLRVETLVKNGYSWTMPQIDAFGYEPEGKHSVGYTEMEDAFNPDKGYVFHMEKIEENNSTNSTGK